MWIKLKNIISENFTRKIEAYGYKYSLTSYIKSLLIFYLVIGLCCLYFKLNYINIFIVLLFAFICFPLIVLSQFKFMFNNKKFENLVGYLEQMIFSFKRNPKILDSLKSTSVLVDESISLILEDAIKIIENDNTGEGYQKAFKYIESNFTCSRVQAMHSFLLSVEENGGKYQHAIDVLLDDIRQWISRTYIYQKELANVKSKIVLSVILSLLIAGTMLIMVPSELVKLNENIIYLTTTTIYFICLITLFVFIQTKLNGEWLIDDSIKEKHLKDKTDYDNKLLIKNLLICSPFFIILLFIRSSFLFYFIVFISVLINLWPFIENKRVDLIRNRNIQKAFPFWLRDISLQVQTLIVPLAIKDSIQSAPNVLKEPLIRLSNDIDEKPDSIEPYNNFLSDYQVPDITNAMKMLYSIQELHTRDIQIQLTALIKRNQELLERAERFQNEDRLSGISFIMAIPMLFATFKLLVDLSIILFSFMNMTSNI